MTAERFPRAAFFGTPEFAAPGRMLGGPVDHRADLYSLTLVALYGLTGRLPFGGGSIESVLARQTLGELPDVRSVRPDVPGELIRVLARGAAAAAAAVLTNSLRDHNNESLSCIESPLLAFGC